MIDRVRTRHSQKRGGSLITSLDTHDAEQLAQPEFLQELGDALDDLSTLEPELAHVVDLKFFCGFTLAEIAVMQNVSERTVQRQWEKARLMLYGTLAQAEAGAACTGRVDNALRRHMRERRIDRFGSMPSALADIASRGGRHAIHTAHSVGGRGRLVVHACPTCRRS